jgi:hypothetical protein
LPAFLASEPEAGVSNRRVGEKESSNDAPHDGHEVASSEIVFEQAGHAIIGREF